MLLTRVGRSYGMNTYPTPDGDLSEALRQVHDLLEQNKPLVVLDGIVDTDAAREFVRQCATGVPVIVTGRQPIAGPWTPITLDTLSTDDSAALYTSSSNLLDPLYNADVAGLSRFLGGNPLAIQLAGRAVIVDDLLPAELLTKLPSSTSRDSALIMTSMLFKQVPSPIQALWLILSVMATGGAGGELLSEISSIPLQNIFPLARGLVARGLATEAMIAEQFVFTLHELAQVYARHWLSQSARLNSLENRVLKAIQGYVDRHTAPGKEHQDRLAVEMSNVLGAAAFATSSGQRGALQQLIDSFQGRQDYKPELDILSKLATLLAENAEVEAKTEIETETENAASTINPVNPGSPVSPAPTVREDISALESASQESEPVESGPEEHASPLAIDLDIETQDLEAATQPVEPTEPMVTVESTQPFPAGDQQRTEPIQPVDADSASHEVSLIEEPTPSPEDTDIPTEGSLSTLQDRLAEAERSGDPRRQAKLLSNIGQYYAERNDSSAASTHYKRALEVYESLDDTDGILAALDALGGLAAHSRDPEGAVLYATRGLNLARSRQDMTFTGRFLTRLGDVRLSLRDIPAAVEAYSQAMEALRSTEDWVSIGLVTAKLGNTYLESQQFKEALMILEQALVIFDKEQRPDYAGRVYGSIGMAYDGLHDLPKASDAFEKALDLTRQNSDQRGEAAQYSALAHLSKQQNDIPGAIDRYRHALHLAYELDDPDLTAEFAFELGTLLIDHPSTLLMGLKLLQESDQAAPNSEARRLLGRANKRLERARAAGLPISPADMSTREYAANA